MDEGTKAIIAASILADEWVAKWLDAAADLLEGGPLRDDIRLEMARSARQVAASTRQSIARHQEWSG